MKINAFLDKVNKEIINKEREDKGIKANGHLVGHVEIKKMIGPYKQIIISVIYINTNNEEILQTIYTDNAPAEKQEEFKENAFVDFVLKFMVFFNENKQKLILGEYGN